MVWCQCEWTEPLDRQNTYTNGLDLLAMEEGVRSMEMRPNLNSYGGESHIDLSISIASIPKWNLSGPTKKFLQKLHENSSQRSIWLSNSFSLAPKWSGSVLQNARVLLFPLSSFSSLQTLSKYQRWWKHQRWWKLHLFSKCTYVIIVIQPDVFI